MSTSQTPFHDMAGPEAFLEKLKAEQSDVSDDPLSTRHAMNAALTAWHMATWVWKHRIKPDWEYRKELGLGKGGHDEFVAAVVERCQSLRTMRDLSNAAKHLTQDVAVDEGEGGFGPGFSPGFDTGPRLVVKKDDGSEVPFRRELGQAVLFWEDFLGRYAERT